MGSCVCLKATTAIVGQYWVTFASQPLESVSWEQIWALKKSLSASIPSGEIKNLEKMNHLKFGRARNEKHWVVYNCFLYGNWSSYEGSLWHHFVRTFECILFIACPIIFKIYQGVKVDLLFITRLFNFLNFIYSIFSLFSSTF